MGIFGYESIADMFDGGGPGASGDTYSNVDNSSLNTDTTNDRDGRIHISHAEAGNQNLAGGIDGSTNDGFLQSVFSPNAGRDDNPDRVGLIDSVMMGIGLTDKTPAYYATTANTIAANQGQGAAQRYLGRLAEDGTISADQFTNFSESASQVPISEQLQNSGDGDGTVDDGTVDDGTVDDGTVDDGTVDDGPQYTQMKPFYGGYQPSTRADTLVPSQGRGLGSFLPNPRLDPIYPQQPPQDFYYHTDPFPPFDPGFNINPGYGKTYPPGYDGSRPVPFETLNPLTGQPQNAPVNNGGQFSSLAELDDFQQQNPTLNLMTEYQRLRALEGGTPAVAQLPPRGVASMFGNEQAPPYMYQGIMG